MTRAACPEFTEPPAPTGYGVPAACCDFDKDALTWLNLCC